MLFTYYYHTLLLWGISYVQGFLNKKNKNWGATKLSGLLGISKSFCRVNEEKNVRACWKGNTKNENWECIEAIIDNHPERLNPSTKLKFINPNATNFTPVAALGIKPTEEEFNHCKIEEKTNVTFNIKTEWSGIPEYFHKQHKTITRNSLEKCANSCRKLNLKRKLSWDTR